ncbi:hypothetical protein [Aliiroseovarius sp. F47248L]|uniref:hypothetical protein n=1 Tax=Aliiroseovarius sp. F47248L TaxID=2926420 RepID=UPI001FF5BBAE|nr:hypothetical protein [Aliiroseovarius sp. F47248L]MCK0138104.1 hypothetical protein [Aliiroseovarius sp. F47248L]
MHNDGKQIHAHIGVDTVFENIFKNIIMPASSDSSNSKTKLVTNVEYKQYLRDSIDRGTPINTTDIVEKLGFRSGALVISRPRFLFSGTPLNNSNVSITAFYKLDGLQNAFSEFRVVFHLFITDHLDYLASGQRKGLTNAMVQNCSWLPLIEAIQSKLKTGNALNVWDTSGGNTFVSRLTEVVGQTNGVDDPVEKLDLGQDDQYSHLHIEKLARERGWDIDALDDAYLNDLDQLFGKLDE